MSTKHYYTDTNGLVLKCLKGLVSCNPQLALNETERVVYDPNHSTKKVSIVSGGGSGHEPAWSGLVGTGMLAAAVNGEIFGSPSAKQVMAGINAVPSEAGTILVITNYSGDKLHFGLASEKAKAAAGGNMKITVLAATDDVALGRKGAGMVGRRGLAGNLLVLKALCAAADKGYDFEKCVKVGTAVNEQMATMGASLDHCHIPGRDNRSQVAQDMVVVGMGIHNEPGLRKVSPIPSPEDLIKEMLLYVCDPNDSDRAFVKFDANDEVALLMNNFGGVSNLEMGGLTNETVLQLEKTWAIKPSRVYSAPFETSLNGPGFSITLFNVTKAAVACGIATEEMLSLLDHPTDAPAWPKTPNWQAKSQKQIVNGHTNGARASIPKAEDILVEPSVLSQILRRSSQRAIDAEPDLTAWDTVVGDGDCGDSVKSLCLAVIKLVDNGLCNSGSVLSVLDGLSSAIDDMGGTLGAIFGIYMSALASALATRARSSQDRSINLWAESAVEALESLKRHTGARVGDRTVMDALIPFVESLDKERDIGKAVEAIRKAAESTRGMKPRFGRATYVQGDFSDAPPDPGAWALMEIITGLNDTA